MQSPEKITTWRDTWRYWSQKVNAVIVALPLAYASIPDKWQDSIPPNWVLVFAGLGITGFIVRNLKQSEK